MKKKRKSLILYSLIVIGILFLVGAIFYFNVQQQYGIGGQIAKTTLSLQDSGDYYLATLKIDFSQPEFFRDVWQDAITVKVNRDSSSPSGSDSIPALPDDIQTGVYFPVHFVDWEFAGKTVDVFDKQGSTVTITEKENNVQCKIDKWGYNPTLQKDGALLTCSGNVVYSLSPTAGSLKRNDLTVKANILKNGIECLDDNYCEDDEECTNKVCELKDSSSDDGTGGDDSGDNSNGNEEPNSSLNPLYFILPIFLIILFLSSFIVFKLIKRRK